MKITYLKLSVSALLLIGIYSCKKGEVSARELESYPASDSVSAVTTDSMSSVATMKVKDKHFIKTADISIEVKDVYQATIAIEKSVQDLGGFVTSSNMKSNIVSENTYDISDEEAVLVKKYQSENTMKVRVPTEKLGNFLELVNKDKVFLNSRSIHAEDITSDIRYAELEEKRNQKTSENISRLKTNKEKVKLDDDNMAESDLQKMYRTDVTDNLKYSVIDIYLKEPKLRIAEIPVTNTTSIDRKYQYNFIYNVKDGFVYGFYLIQQIIVALINIWPVLFITGGVIYFLRKRKRSAVSAPKTRE